MRWFKYLNGETVGFIVTVMFVLASISASYGVSQHQLNDHEERLKEVDRKVNHNENLLIEVAADVRWMRARMARDDRLGLGSRFGDVPGNNPANK